MNSSLFIHLTLVPYIVSAGELKTKPTQHSVKELRTIGIQPDILICRSEQPIPAQRASQNCLVYQCRRKGRDFRPVDADYYLSHSLVTARARSG